MTQTDRGKGGAVWRLLIVVALALALVGGGVLVRESTAVAQANPIRDLPDVPVRGGESFDVVVRFTASEDGFRSIGLEDAVPAGWAIQTNTAWCTPNADGMQTSGGKAQYIWIPLDPYYAAGTQFTGVYRVTVPADAAVASYAFNGQIGYRIYDMPRVFNPIAGEGTMNGLGIGSTDGGEVTTPGEGVFVCTAGSVVDLAAVADEGYGFVGWTGDVGTVADVDSAQTTITTDSRYSVAANFAQGTPVVGVTREVNCALLPGVTVTLFQGDVEVGSAVSDGNGDYRLIAPAIGEYTLVASKAEFRDETQTIEVLGPGPEFTVVCDFAREYGLIPNAPDMWYALDCQNLWQYPPNEECALDMWTALDVMNAWQYPIP